MKHYLIDTNVVIDLLLDREGADAACNILDGAERGEYKLKTRKHKEEKQLNKIHII